MGGNDWNIFVVSIVTFSWKPHNVPVWHTAIASPTFFYCLLSCNAGHLKMATCCIEAVRRFFASSAARERWERSQAPVTIMLHLRYLNTCAATTRFQWVSSTTLTTLKNHFAGNCAVSCLINCPKTSLGSAHNKLETCQGELVYVESFRFACSASPWHLTVAFYFAHFATMLFFLLFLFVDTVFSGSRNQDGAVALAASRFLQHDALTVSHYSFYIGFYCKTICGKMLSGNAPVQTFSWSLLGLARIYECVRVGVL